MIAGIQSYGVTVDRTAFCYRTDSVLAQIAAVEAGLGIGAGLLQAFEGRAVKRVLNGQIGSRSTPMSLRIPICTAVHESACSMTIW